MKNLLLTSAAALILTAAPAWAQHEGHGNHTPEAAPAANPSPEAPAASDMSAMPDMPGMDHEQHAPQAEHAEHGPLPAPASDPHAHHNMPGMPMPGDAAPAKAPPPPAALSGPAHAADTLYPSETMATARATMAKEMGPMTITTFRLDRLELQSGKGRDGWLWDADLSYGGDIDKLWLKSEGHGTFGRGTEAEVQALWSHAISPWFDAQAGLRQQFGKGPDRTQLALGLQGLAPYLFELDGAAFLSTKGELTARIGAEYEQRITQRVILQPRTEVNLSAQNIPELGLGSGLTSIQLGARLRYEVIREFAPYIGVEWQRDLGGTARMSRAAGDRASRVLFVAGIRAWF